MYIISDWFHKNRYIKRGKHILLSVMRVTRASTNILIHGGKQQKKKRGEKTKESSSEKQHKMMNIKCYINSVPVPHITYIAQIYLPLSKKISLCFRVCVLLLKAWKFGWKCRLIFCYSAATLFCWNDAFKCSRTNGQNYFPEPNFAGDPITVLQPTVKYHISELRLQQINNDLQTVYECIQ